MNELTFNLTIYSNKINRLSKWHSWYVHWTSPKHLFAKTCKSCYNWSIYEKIKIESEVIQIFSCILEVAAESRQKKRKKKEGFSYPNDESRIFQDLADLGRIRLVNTFLKRCGCVCVCVGGGRMSTSLGPFSHRPLFLEKSIVSSTYHNILKIK